MSPNAALLVIIATGSAFNILRSTVLPDRWHLLFNATLGLLAFGVGRLAGLGTEELGVGPGTYRRGLRFGSIAFVAISALVLAGGLAGIVTDDGAGIATRPMLIRVLVVIPLGTVLGEELLFRGALHGVLIRRFGINSALVMGSVLFGLWHVFPASRGGSVSAGEVSVTLWPGLLAIFGATCLAGLGFLWLRARSNSLVAPIMAHLATNSVTFFVAWLVARR